MVGGKRVWLVLREAVSKARKQKENEKNQGAELGSREVACTRENKGKTSKKGGEGRKKRKKKREARGKKTSEKHNNKKTKQQQQLTLHSLMLCWTLRKIWGVA